MAYKHLFFDWDHTLWDFETNSKQALETIFYDFDLRQYGVLSPQHFIDVYKPINYAFWKEFREGKIDVATVKKKRFEETFKQFAVMDDELVTTVKQFYLDRLPLAGALMPNVIETLQTLKEHYQLHIVTNGFLEVTKHKLKYSNVEHFFSSVLSAEEVGVLKPNPKVFHTALTNNKTHAKESLFIGDNLIADVAGARGVGMDQVFFNPEQLPHQESPTYEISNIAELVGLLESL